MAEGLLEGTIAEDPDDLAIESTVERYRFDPRQQQLFNQLHFFFVHERGHRIGPNEGRTFALIEHFAGDLNERHYGSAFVPEENEIEKRAAGGPVDRGLQTHGR